MPYDVDVEADGPYLDVIRSALRVCLNYKPACGQGRSAGVTLEEFQRLYSDDEFYAWFGLDSPLVYAAHKAAGGLTSVYRQIGIACQTLFCKVLQDGLGLTAPDATWFYSVPRTKGKPRKLSLDGRIPLARVLVPERRRAVEAWLTDAAARVNLRRKKVRSLEGCVFEVRQGYKSNDAKRQNADIANAASAYAHDYLPVMLLLSTQIPANLAERYVRARWLLLRGVNSGSPVESTYAFCRDVLGYDLAGFFQRNSGVIKAETLTVLKGLLQ
jgi:hypothetical protein